MPPIVARLAVEMSGANRRPCGLELRIQFVEHDAGLDAHPSFLDIQLEDVVVILRRVDLQALADRLPGLRRAAAAHRERASELAADFDDADDVLARSSGRRRLAARSDRRWRRSSRERGRPCRIAPRLRWLVIALFERRYVWEIVTRLIGHLSPSRSN